MNQTFAILSDAHDEALQQLTFLTNEAVWVRAIWKNYQMLRSLTHEDRKMLAGPANTFFYITQHALLHDVVSILRRAADREKMQEKQNVTLKGLVEAYKQFFGNQLAHPLDTDAATTELDRFINHTSKLKDARDEVFSHNDRAVVLKVRSVSGIEAEHVSAAIKALCDCLDVLNTAQCGGRFEWEDFKGNADDLISHIRAFAGTHSVE